MAPQAGKSKAGTKKRAAKKSTAKKAAGRAPRKAGPKRVASHTLSEETTYAVKDEVRETPSYEPAAIPSASGGTGAISSESARGVRSRDITAFLRQFIMLLEAGTPILKSLKSLSKRGEHQGIKTMVRGITEYVESGNTLWQAFAREKKHFRTVEINLIKAAEASGTLTTVLKRLTSYREQQESLRKRIRVALIYPTLVMALCFGAVFVIAYVLIPMIEELFSDMGQELSGLAGKLVWGSHVIKSGGFWALLITAAVAVIVGYIMMARTPQGRLRLDQWMLKVPVFGKLEKQRNTVDFCRTFALMLRSGVSMMATLELVRNAVNNQVYAQAIQDMRDSVERGEGLEAPLRASERKRLLDGVAVDMLVTGEESGTIDTIADQIADNYEEDIRVTVDSLGEILLPGVVVFMGGVVVIVALAVYLPMIEMMQNI